jgi:hypothetical protein
VSVEDAEEGVEVAGGGTGGVGDEHVVGVLHVGPPPLHGRYRIPALARSANGSVVVPPAAVFVIMVAAVGVIGFVALIVFTMLAGFVASVVFVPFPVVAISTHLGVLFLL